MADTSPKDSATTALPGGAHIVHVHGVDMVLFSSGIAIPLPPHQEVATNATGDTTDTNTNTDSSPTSGGKATRFLVDGFEVVQQDDGFTTVDVPGAGLRLVKAPGQGPVAVVRIEERKGFLDEARETMGGLTAVLGALLVLVLVLTSVRSTRRR